MRDYSFYTLLYVDVAGESAATNGVHGDFDRQIQTYIRCCQTLSKSLEFFTSKELVVLTNQREYLEHYSQDLHVVEIPFQLNVPRKVAFYSAHFKLDVFQYFKSLGDGSGYCILIDSDVLCLSAMPTNLKNCIDSNIPTFYNVTSQRYPAYGRDRLIQDKDILMSGKSSLGIWVGGEFLGGDSEFYAQLDEEIQLLQDDYFQNCQLFHHQGDEVLVSVALEKLMRKGMYCCDVGSFGVISRFWSVPTLHVQNRWKAFESNFLIHLPMDKSYISNLRRVDSSIKTRLGRYLYWKIIVNYLKDCIKKMLPFLSKR
ncbi:hypothetical protein [Sunxiuqinia sp. sy24]|uniref:hypothetical protein n=1 Tax=Sunxiuqinia sp. sy24 TaxID=3461495 RepID=UPI004045D5F1